MSRFDLPLLPTATALGVGLLLGLVAERRKLANPAVTAGLRSHTLVAIAGAVTLWLGMPAFIAALLAATVLAGLGYMRTSADDPGLTSELALLTSCLLGGLAMRAPLAASALAVVVAVLIHAKSNLHRISRELISDREMADGLMLLSFALIVLPVLPDRPVDPYGAFNPATIWKLVVLVMAVGAVGHIALRVVGTRWGLPVSGFFSGFVSATAATASFGQQARAQPALASSSVGAAMLANLASLSLFVPILLVVAPELFRASRWILLAAGVALLLHASLGLFRGKGVQVPPPAADSRMFRIGQAVGFAALIAAVMGVSSLLGQWLGPNGAMAAAFLTALAELQAAMATIASLFQSGMLEVQQGRWAIVGLLAASALAKSVVAFSAGGTRYGLRVTLGLWSMVGAGALAAAFS
jgi:uncharacterized membrane protein (DUF4010 family)